MSEIVSIHSFRGGTGKSNTTANLAVAIARMGKRVAIVDTDIQSPGNWTGLAGLAEGWRDFLGAWDDLGGNRQGERVETAILILDVQGERRGRAAGV